MNQQQITVAFQVFFLLVQLVALLWQISNWRKVKRALQQIRGMSIDSEVAYATEGLRKEVTRLRKDLRRARES